MDKHINTVNRIFTEKNANNFYIALEDKLYIFDIPFFSIYIFLSIYLPGGLLKTFDHWQPGFDLVSESVQEVFLTPKNINEYTLF